MSVLGLRAGGIACVGLSVMMDGFNLKSLQKQLLLRKCDLFFCKVHEEQEKKNRFSGALWGLLLWCPVVEYRVLLTELYRGILEPSEGSRSTGRTVTPSQTCWQI